jgi:hypothetical protein
MKIELRIWKKFFAQFEGQFLIGGNFNGHHHSWGNSKNCTTGNNLYHCISKLETNITLLNDGSQTYISIATGSKAVLDLTYVDPRSALLCTWKVGTDPWNNDDFKIFIEYDGIIEPRKGSERASRLQNKETDWTALMGKVKEIITEVQTHNGWNGEMDVKESYENIIHIFKGKLEETAPKKKNNLGNGGQGKKEVKLYKQSVYGKKGMR